MKRFFLLMVCAATLLSVWANQTLVLLNGDEIKVKIERIGEQEITYKKASNPNGPTYTVKRNQVFYIIHDDGTREVISKPGEAAAATNSTSLGNTTLGNALLNNFDSNEVAEEHKIFDHICLNPRVFLGGEEAEGFIKDTDNSIRWGGFAWRVDFNVLMPDGGGNSAWSIGLGLVGRSGQMKFDTGKKNSKAQEMGNLTALYLGIPIYYWYAFSDYFMVGLSENFQFRLSQKVEGQKVDDVLSVFRFPIGLHAVGRVGGFELGLEFNFNLGNNFVGDNMGWSPSFGIGATLGYAF